MKPAPFDYSRPAALSVAMTEIAGEDVKLLAGGQSLVPMLNLRLASTARLVDIRHIAELAEVRETPTSIIYGALTTHAAFEDRRVPDGSNGLMPRIASAIAFRSVRNRGTIGGALALADPAADWLTTTIALEGKIHILGADGPRVVPAEEFALGPYFTALQEGEILTAVEISRRPASERWGVNKVTIKIGDYAHSLAIALLDKAAGKARIALGAVDGAPLVLAATAAAVLAGARGEALRSAVAAELDASGREFAPSRRTTHITAVARAVEDALR